MKNIGLFDKNNYWKLLLMLLGAFILLATLLYSNYLAESLKSNEEKNIFLFKRALEEFIKQDIEQNQNDITFLTEIINSFPLPVVLEDDYGELSGMNFIPEERNSNIEFLAKKRKEFLEKGDKPLEGRFGYARFIYSFNSPLLRFIKLFPLIQGLLVGLFIALGYFLFSSSRKAEQNRIYAGMAKETAHQLGTPISAIMGWIEYLQVQSDISSDVKDVLIELSKDVDRLELVADRFSKIGSDPVLEPVDLYNELIEVKDYLQRRSPRKVYFNFIAPSASIEVYVNKHLFAWVIENLIRNSLDAMDGKGTITCTVDRQGEKVMIFLTDTGHGIPANQFSTIFKPGYSTKKRGWGLGLSLAKRIIEQYHKGKIFVKSSKPHEETTFAIILNSKPIIKH